MGTILGFPPDCEPAEFTDQDVLVVIGGQYFIKYLKIRLLSIKKIKPDDSDTVFAQKFDLPPENLLIFCICQYDKPFLQGIFP